MNFPLPNAFSHWLTAILLFLGTALFAQPCYISQPEASAFANISATTAVGQSFTACGDGVVTEVTLNIIDLEASAFTFQMSTGSSTLTPEYTQQIEVNEDGEFVVLLDTPFPLTDGEVYAFSVVGVSGEGTLGNLTSVNGNPYAGGNAFGITGGELTNYDADHTFALSIVPAACTQAQRVIGSRVNFISETEVGQNFTACTDGAITQLQFNAVNLEALEFRIQLSTGENTLTPDYVQDYTATSSVGIQHVTLNTPFPVAAGDTFAFSIISLDQTGAVTSISSIGDDQYTSGYFYTITDGSVRVFETSDLAFAVTVVEMTCLIDQPKPGGMATSNSTITVGQSFTACKNGRVSHIRFNNQQGNLREIRLDLSKGDNTLEADYSQTVTIEGAGSHLIPLFKSFNVLDGEVYSFSITPLDEETDFISSSGEDFYPEGRIFFIVGGDVGTGPPNDLDFSILTFEDDGVVSLTKVEDLSIRLKGAFPNPASGTVTVPYSLDQSRAVTIQLYDVTGREQKHIVKGQQPAGEYQENIAIMDLPAGLYFYRIQTESGQSATKRIVVQ